MLRTRLHSRTGCVRCKLRRKKCDETKPVCLACQRNRFTCTWDPQRSIRLPARVPSDTPTSTASVRIKPPLNLRAPDFATLERHENDRIKDLRGFVEDRSVQNFYTCDEDEFASERFVAHGVRDGWHVVSTHPQASSMAILDRHLENCGHGQAARVAVCWLYHILQTCLQHGGRDNGQLLWAIPEWYRPVNLERQKGTVAPNAIDFIAWPRIRQRLVREPSTYNHDRFLQELTSSGLRFIWPFSYDNIAVVNRVTGDYQFSDEFRMRVTNLRSYCLAKSFLDKYPTLRSDAAQLEPSLSTYRASDVIATESLYWNQVRQGRQQEPEEENIAGK